MSKTVIITRGTSGAGKSSFAELVAEPKVIVCADFFFEKNGGYDFDPSKIGQAHQQCKDAFDAACVNPDVANIIVANTNTKASDFKYYVDKANEYGYKIVFVVLEKRHDGVNQHNVPSEVLERQHNNLINSLKLK